MPLPRLLLPVCVINRAEERPETGHLVDGIYPREAGAERLEIALRKQANCPRSGYPPWLVFSGMIVRAFLNGRLQTTWPVSFSASIRKRRSRTPSRTSPTIKSRALRSMCL